MAAAPHPRISLLADAVAVVVFAAVGRLSHGEPDDLLGLAGTVAPFAVGLLAARAIPAVRRDPAGWRAGAVVVVCVAGVGLLLRAGLTGRLPLSFAVVTTISLAVLVLGWRGLAALVSRRAHRAAR
jgi:asparagine N-glycosylation enzyme membrane subunit Stt3